MENQNIDVVLENQSLRNEFVIRNLDLAQVFFDIPDDLERENRCLHHLLDWVQKYAECGDRKKMESDGYEFPPIDPDFSPDDDWYRFERWMKGLPVRQKLKDQLPRHFCPVKPEDLTEDELDSQLQKMTDHLEEIGFGISFRDDIPARLVYKHLYEMLDDEFELSVEGFWHLDGCSGYCPDCFQRPWCESGTSSCWAEDKKAGEMYLISDVREYVSASIVSLAILQKLQAEEDERFEEFKKKQKDNDSFIEPSPFDPSDDDLPF